MGELFGVIIPILFNHISWLAALPPGLLLQYLVKK
jgi:hypothetical protein